MVIWILPVDLGLVPIPNIFWQRFLIYNFQSTFSPRWFANNWWCYTLINAYYQEEMKNIIKVPRSSILKVFCQVIHISLWCVVNHWDTRYGQQQHHKLIDHGYDIIMHSWNECNVILLSRLKASKTSSPHGELFAILHLTPSYCCRERYSNHQKERLYAEGSLLYWIVLRSPLMWRCDACNSTLIVGKALGQILVYRWCIAVFGRVAM